MVDEVYAGLNLPGMRVHERDAPFWRRTAAFLLDILILDFLVVAPFRDALLGTVSWERIIHGAFVFPSTAYAAGVVIALLAFGYFALFEYTLCQTPGMMLFSIQTQGVTLTRAFIRNLYLVPLFPFPLLWIVEPLFLLFLGTRWLERLSGTRTIERIAY